MKKIGRGCFSTFVVFLTLILFGALFQWASENSDKSKIPGELISVDMHQFHLLCKGKGNPLVLLENGLWGSYPDWMYTIDGISKETKVCAYDRLGMGWSSANNKPTRANDVAKNLNNLLKAADLNEPMIVVGFSAGGLYVREYSKQFPENVVGMMLVDSAHEQQAFRMEYIPKDLTLEKMCKFIAWTGVARIFGLFENFVEPSFSAELHQEQLSAYNRTNFCAGLVLQSQGMEQDLFMNSAPSDLGDLPLTVIRAGKPLREQALTDEITSDFLDEHEKDWPQLQEELSNLSKNSTYIVAKGSGHAIQLEQPEIVICALNVMISEYRSKAP